MPDVTVNILVGDVRERLAEVPDASVQMCVTSPPYFGLRDYGHAGQIGLEPTPDAYVAELVAVFREVRRVLKDDGTLWLNLGDSYAGSGKGGNPVAGKQASNAGSQSIGVLYETGRTAREAAVTNVTRKTWEIGMKPKDLIGIPWRVAFALQADGWYLRSDIIWHKPNPIPESVTDRPTKSHEYLFLLAKSERYYYDADAIAEPSICTDDARFGGPRIKYDGKTGLTEAPEYQGQRSAVTIRETRNKRTVWTIATQPFKGAHFATFPPALIEPCILAGSRVAGKRCDCDVVVSTPTGEVESADPTATTGRAGMNRPRGASEGTLPITRREQRHHARELRDSPHRAAMEAEAGSAFDHYIRTDASGARPVSVSLREIWRARGWITDAPPCDCPIFPADTVLDPFGGAGRTGLVADRLGRNAILCELNPAYAQMAERRIHDDAPLFALTPTEGTN